MAYQVVWSSKAVEDVDAIAAYIARDSPSYAATVVQKIMETTRYLSDCGLEGTIVPEFNETSIREKKAYSYRLIYRIQEGTVSLAAVVHSKNFL
jgi:plasmid stabilization system protein ParE